MEEQILFSFIKLDLVQFATFEADYIDDEMPLDLSSSFLFTYSSDDVVCCTTTVVITKANNPVLKAELNSYFKIRLTSAAFLTKDDCVVLPTVLMAPFVSPGYGSMRGVIFAKTMGTPLEKIILPPNDVQYIFTYPAKFINNLFAVMGNQQENQTDKVIENISCHCHECDCGNATATITEEQDNRRISGLI